MNNPYPFFVTIILMIPALVILLPGWMRSRERQRILDTVVRAAEKGISLPENVIQALIRAAAGGRQPTAPDPSRDMRRGVFLTMIGFSIALVGLAVGLALEDDGAPAGVMIAAVGAIPICIGLGYIGVARMGERAPKSIVE